MKVSSLTVLEEALEELDDELAGVEAPVLGVELEEGIAGLIRSFSS
jgi:hypothetical protein